MIRELALLPGHVTPIVSRRCAQGTEPLGAGDYATAEKAVISLKLSLTAAPLPCAERLRQAAEASNLQVTKATEYISRVARDQRYY